MMMKFLVVALLATSTAYANPRALPFTYTTDTLAPGAAELLKTLGANEKCRHRDGIFR